MTINLATTESSVHKSQIEWDVLVKIITQFAYFESVKFRLTSRIFRGELDSLNFELIHTQDYLNQIKDEHRQSLSQLLTRLPSDDSLNRHMAHVSKKGILNFSELNKIILLIESAQFMKQVFTNIKIWEFNEINKTDFLPLHRHVLKEFRYLVDEAGNVYFDKHPVLAELTKKLRELEERIRRSIQDWINDSQNQKVLQYSSYDIHHDRFVVPVRSDSYRSELGLIVSRSESGQTLFVEPFEVRDFCNKRLELIAKIDEMINQLAMKFSFALFDYSQLISELHEKVELIDFYLAKSAFALSYKLECPRVREKPGFKFTQLFHPLISNPVKNTADCFEHNKGIVISGPNTGGKTVFLKSIALSYLLFYHGFFVPANEAEMYPYEGLFYFGNDLQDLKTGLSSFSGEVKNYIELIEQILPSNLVLIDEIFNSTSSDEASALSLAYFNELHRKATCHIVVSTHHQMFKTLIHQDNSYLSCHVGFDTKQMQPTYKIQWGTPGSSMAIDIFRILSRGHDRVERVPGEALKQLNSKNISYETLLQKVSQKQIELDQLLSSNRQLEIELKNQKGSMEGVLNLRLNDEINRAKIEINKIINEAKDLVEDARRSEIKKTRTIDERSHQLLGKIHQLRGHEDQPNELAIVTGNLNLQELKVGDWVYSVTLKKEFLVHKIDYKKDEVLIGKGAIKINVPANTLSQTKQSPSTPKVSISYIKTGQAQFEFDARGMRLSEFQNLTDSALGDLLSGDIPFLNIIHGHGDGILKNWLRDYIKRSKDFSIDQSESGNDGETRIVLK